MVTVAVVDCILLVWYISVGKGLARDWTNWGGTAWDGMGWDGMGWDGMGWEGMGWDGLGWVGMRWKGMGRVEISWDGLGGSPIGGCEDVRKVKRRSARRGQEWG